MRLRREGTCWRLALVGAAVATMAALSTGCGEGSADEGPSADEIAALASEHAPLVGLHPDERWWPIGADAFIRRSRLRWLAGSCGTTTVTQGAPAAERLGSGGDPYRHTPRRPPGCARGKAWTADDYTRPYDSLRGTIALEEGFFLDLEDGARRGTPPGTAGTVDAPAYYEAARESVRGRPQLRIDYWMLFGMTRSPGPRAIVRRFAHEGDWIRVGVLLRDPDEDGEYEPRVVRYHYDSRVTEDVPWADAPRASGGAGRAHPVVYISRGSHKPRSEPGRWETNGAIGTREFTLREEASDCPPCVEWRTWRDLRDARAQPWWGYGGAWGATPPPSQVPAGLGPSRWVDVEPHEL